MFQRPYRLAPQTSVRLARPLDLALVAQYTAFSTLIPTLYYIEQPVFTNTHMEQ